MTQINIKRVYETPSSNDGYRVLVDRLWPRGMKREYLKYDYWAKELTPSNDLRKWFHADVEKDGRPLLICTKRNWNAHMLLKRSLIG